MVYIERQLVNMQITRDCGVLQLKWDIYITSTLLNLIDDSGRCGRKSVQERNSVHLPKTVFSDHGRILHT